MGTRTAIRVLIADDNVAVRRGLRLRLDHAKGVTVVGEASNGVDAVVIARTERADVVLMDLQMPGGSGLAATRVLAGPGVESPVAVIAVTNHATPAYVLAALDAGAIGYLLKSDDTQDLLTAIRAAARGEAPVSSSVNTVVIEELARRGRAITDPLDPSIEVLTPAERKVAGQLAQGRIASEDIAAALYVSVNTVRSQVYSAMRKTGFSDRAQLALWAVRRGLDREQPAEPPPQ